MWGDLEASAVISSLAFKSSTLCFIFKALLNGSLLHHIQVCRYDPQNCSSQASIKCGHLSAKSFWGWTKICNGQGSNFQRQPPNFVFITLCICEATQATSADIRSEVGHPVATFACRGGCTPHVYKSKIKAQFEAGWRLTARKIMR